MTGQDTADKIRKSITFEPLKKETNEGEQSTAMGMIQTGTALISKELYLRIEVDYSRSQIENRELALAMFELALEKILKV